MGVNLMIAVHNHQPVGNFPWVFEGAYERSYRPFLEVLKKHPNVRITLHNSGPLIDWMEKNRPEYLDDVSEMASRGQIEVMGGGYYEPIISIIPHQDAKAQIEQMSRYIARRFGKKPAGMWMTERVWEPSLPRIIEGSGIRYTLLDDTHFRYAGLGDADLFGYYLTECEGHPLSVFPIDRGLRYSIPFQEPDRTIERLRIIDRDRPGAGVVYGDDGEKFGLWPGTHEWVYEKGWLERFFGALDENRDWIGLMTFSEYLDRFAPTGRVYLPTASYEEMMEWALPAEAIGRYKGVKRRLEETGIMEDARPFVRGGFFPNFLTKYIEADNMHKRMLFVSGRVRNAPAARRKKAMPLLLAAQCNCAYWHGLFGGLYLNYLRHAIYENLCRAQQITDEGMGAAWERRDFNIDGHEEVLVSTPAVFAGIAPALGGSLFSLDLVEYAFSLSNTMKRVVEAYHADFKHAAERGEAGEGAPASIHDQAVVKEEGLLDILTYDTHPRYSFMDHFFTAPPPVLDLVGNRYEEAGDFLAGTYTTGRIQNVPEGVEVLLERGGTVAFGSKRVPLRIKKGYTIGVGPRIVGVRYEIENGGDEPVSTFFGVESNYTLLGGNDGQRYLSFADGSRALMREWGEVEEARAFRLVNEYDGFEAAFSFSDPCRLVHFGVETASNSEGGLERTYQGTCIVAIFPVALLPGKRRVIETTVTLTDIRKKG